MSEEEASTHLAQLVDLLRVAITPPAPAPVRAIALAAFTSGMLVLLGMQYAWPAIVKVMR